MTLENLKSQFHKDPTSIEFADIIALISELYDYTPTRFSNGKEGDTVINEAGSNEGSCKIFAFAKLNSFSEEETLACFGSFYRSDVLNNPTGNDHANIRSFMKYGWAGISFAQQALAPKNR